MRFSEATARLVDGLRELPGAAAHARLAPRPRRQWPAGFNPARIRLAAGLLLVFPAATNRATHAEHTERVDHPRSAGVPDDTDAEAHIVLTVRSESVRHGGQVSLPGGVVDPGETFEQAALREAHEEIGLAADGVRILGPLTPIDIPVSGFRLHPIVAAVDHAPLLRPSDDEVARILEVGIDELLDTSRLTETERTRDGRALVVPAFQHAGVEIWGATAMILAEFLTVLGWREA